MMQVAHPFAGIVPNDREVPAPVAVIRSPFQMGAKSLRFPSNDFSRLLP